MSFILKSNNNSNALYLISYAAFLSSIVFSFRGISSISLAAIILIGIFRNESKFREISQQKGTYLFILSSAAYFVLQSFSHLYHNENEGVARIVILNSGTLFLPVAVILSKSFIKKAGYLLINTLLCSLIIACTFCLILGIVKFINSGDSGVFFYRQLVEPMHHHPVYFSILVFIGLVYAAETPAAKLLWKEGFTNWLVIIFFALVIFLLSSKLVIFFCSLYLAILVLRTSGKNLLKALPILFFLLLAVIALSFVTSNRISDRFRDFIGGHPGILKKEKFDPGYYFNGFEFRLLQWKFVPSILSSEKKWTTGVGPVNAQQFLDREYKQRNMYIGDPERKDRGLLGYNTHNQLLQSLLENGIPGLLIYLVLLFSLVRMIMLKKNTAFTIIILLVAFYSLVESILKTQYGIILFVFLPIFLFILPDHSLSKKTSK